MLGFWSYIIKSINEAKNEAKNEANTELLTKILNQLKDKLSEVSAAAERTQLYRARKAAVITLKSDPTAMNLWNCVCLFAGYPFQTSGRGNHPGSKFKYEVAEAGGSGGKHYEGESVDGYGNELWIVSSSGEKREKSISRSSVDYALKIALEGSVTGPKQLKIYGASYVYALFKRFGMM